jgi:hypothetical protein
MKNLRTRYVHALLGKGHLTRFTYPINRFFLPRGKITERSTDARALGLLIPKIKYLLVKNEKVR